MPSADKYLRDTDAPAPEASATEVGGTALEEFSRAAAYSALQGPMDGLAQLAGYKAPTLISAPKELEFGSSGWYAQQFGGGLGALPLFVGVNKTVGRMTGPLCHPVTRAALTGMAFEGLFHAADPKGTPEQIMTERGKAAVFGGVTFAAMAGVSHSCAKNGMRISGPQPPSWSLRRFGADLATNGSRGIVAGSVGGLVQAELQALSHGKPIADSEEYLKSAYTFAVTGAGLDMMGTHRHQAPNAATLNDSGVTTIGGRHSLARDTVIMRTGGTFEAARWGRTVELQKGDSLFKPDAVAVGLRGGFQFEQSKLQWNCDSQGRVQQIADPARKTTTFIDYIARRDQTIASVRTTTLSGGTDNNLWLKRNSATREYYDKNSVALGTEARLQLDGSVKITGEGVGSETAIGKYIFSNGGKIDSVTVRRDGLRDLQVGKDVTLTKTRNDVLIGVTNGTDHTEFGYDKSGQLNRVAFLGGNELKLRSGKWYDQRNTPVATAIQLGGEGVLTIEPTDNVRFPRTPHEALKKAIIYTTHGETSLKFPSATKAPLDNGPVPVRATPAEILQHRIASSELKPGPHETFVHSGSGTERVYYNRDGVPIHVTDATGLAIKITRDGRGEATALNYSRNGVTERTVEKLPDGWVSRDAHGRSTPRRDVTVHLDGSITELNHQPGLDWTGIRTRPDGVRVHVDKVGRERISESHLELERSRISETVKRLSGDRAQIARVEGFMTTFESRAKARVPAVPTEEVANTYYQVDKLLTTEDALLPRQTRLELAEQFLFKAAYPHTIGQGPFSTCNVTAEFENRFITKYPSAVIRVVTDAATTGRVVTTNGSLIDTRELKNVFTPINTTPSTFNFIEYRGRDYFDQLYQTIAVNAHWQLRSTKYVKATSTVDDLRAGKPFVPGQIRYEFSTLTPRPEVLVDYGYRIPERRNSSVRFKELSPISGLTKTSAYYEPASSPKLSVSDYKSIERELLGFTDGDHILASTSAAVEGAVIVDSPQELAVQLNAMKKAGVLPATVVVNPNTKLMRDVIANPNYISSHVVNVQNIFEIGGKWKIEMTNQWGSNSDFLGRDRAIHVESLWESMSDAKPEPEVKLPEPLKPSHRLWIATAALDALVIQIASNAARDNQKKRHDGPTVTTKSESSRPQAETTK